VLRNFISKKQFVFDSFCEKKKSFLEIGERLEIEDINKDEFFAYFDSHFLTSSHLLDNFKFIADSLFNKSNGFYTLSLPKSSEEIFKLQKVAIKKKSNSGLLVFTAFANIEFEFFLEYPNLSGSYDRLYYLVKSQSGFFVDFCLFLPTAKQYYFNFLERKFSSETISLVGDYVQLLPSSEQDSTLWNKIENMIGNYISNLAFDSG